MRVTIRFRNVLLSCLWSVAGVACAQGPAIFKGAEMGDWAWE